MTEPASVTEVPPPRDEQGLQGLAADWYQIFVIPGWAGRMATALQLNCPPTEKDSAALAVAQDLGWATAHVVALDAAAKDTARQWRFADKGEAGVLAIVVPVAIDQARSYYAPGQLPISIGRLGDDVFLESICDLVAVPVFGAGVPLSMTGLTLAVGRFAARERGEVEIYATGMGWLRAHLARAAELESEVPPHLVPQQLETPDHFSTVILEPKAIEWRPQTAWCAFPRETSSLLIHDSMGLANVINGLMRRKDAPPRYPKVFGPKASPA